MSDVQCLQSSQLCVAQHGPGGRARLTPGKVRYAAKHDFTAYRAAWRGTRRRHIAAHDRFPGKNRILKAAAALPLSSFCVPGTWTNIAFSGKVKPQRQVAGMPTSKWNHPLEISEH